MTNPLHDAEHTAAVVSAMGPTVFPTNGPARIAEGMLQVALADAQTNRVRLLVESLRNNKTGRPADLVKAEVARLLRIMTATPEEGSDDAETA